MKRIDLEKPIRTKDGKPVEIISDKGRGLYPLFGYIGDDFYLRSWTSDGEYIKEAVDDPVLGDDMNIENYDPEPEPWAAEKAAYAEGKTIQFTDDREHRREWQDAKYPSWVTEKDDGIFLNPRYRIKPEPQWVPLEPDDITTGMEFFDGQTRYQWGSVDQSGVTLDGIVFPFDELSKDGWSYRTNGEDWKPCKKEVEL